jgi:hypothetical protein
MLLAVPRYQGAYLRICSHHLPEASFDGIREQRLLPARKRALVNNRQSC